MRPDLLSLLLRLASLAAKFALYAYMAAAFSLAETGVYGLVFSTVMILTTLCGLRFDAFVAREIAQHPDALVVVRSYVLLCLAGHLVWLAGIYPLSHLVGVDWGWLALCGALSLGETLASALSAVLVALGRPLRSVGLFSICSILWIVLAIGAGIVAPAWRTATTVCLFWLAGIFLQTLLAARLWSIDEWRRVFAQPFDYREIGRGLRVSVPFLIGSLALVLGGSFDRFWMSKLLGLSAAGVLTVFVAMASTVPTLVFAHVTAFAQRSLILLRRGGSRYEYAREVSRIRIKAMGLSSLLCLALAGAAEWLAILSDKPALMSERPVLWLILAGAWFNGCALVSYCQLYSQERDRVLWLGDVVYMLVSVVANLSLAESYGLIGAGWSALISGVFIFAWRGYFARQSVGVTHVQGAG